MLCESEEPKHQFANDQRVVVLLTTATKIIIMELQVNEPNTCNRADTGKRIPLTLQAVFLNGNRGKEVHTPPPDASAMKVFNRVNPRGTRWRPFRSWSSNAAPSRNSIATMAETASEEMEVSKKQSPVRKVKRSKVSDFSIVMNVHTCKQIP